MVSWGKVVRRGSYKGAVEQCGPTLPMDCTSVPGMLLILCCFLTAKGLNPAQLEACEKTLTRLEHFACHTGTLKLLPHFKESWIKVDNNRILIDALLPTLKEVGITIKRPGSEHLFV